MPRAQFLDPSRDPHASANEVALYGGQLHDVRFLRRRGYGVHMEGALFRVGNRLMSRHSLVALAERERSLLGRT
jgi:hypothetical protein